MLWHPFFITGSKHSNAGINFAGEIYQKQNLGHWAETIKAACCHCCYYASMFKLVLHWLEASRSQRVLWLLEELSLPYELKVYLRDEHLGNTELKKYHPLGRSPILQVINDNGEEQIVAETSVIFKYLLNNYDTNEKFTPKSPEEKAQLDYYLDFCDASLQPSLISLFVGKLLQKDLSEKDKPKYKEVIDHVNGLYDIPATKRNLQFLDDELAKSQSGWFIGDSVSAADFIFEYALYQNLFDPKINASDMLGVDFQLKKNYPHISKWAEKVAKDPVHIKITNLAEEKLKKLKASQ